MTVSTTRFALIASLLIGFTHSNVARAEVISPIKRSTEIIESIIERASENSRRKKELSDLFEIEIGKVTEFLELRPKPYFPEASDEDEELHRDIRSLVLLISREVVFTKNKFVRATLNYNSDDEAKELLHNLIALAKIEIDAPVDLKRGDLEDEAEFERRMKGLALVFPGSHLNTKDPIESLEVEHEFTLPASAKVPEKKWTLAGAISKFLSTFLPKQGQPTMTEEEKVAVYDIMVEQGHFMDEEYDDEGFNYHDYKRSCENDLTKKSYKGRVPPKTTPPTTK